MFDDDDEKFECTGDGVEPLSTVFCSSSMGLGAGDVGGEDISDEDSSVTTCFVILRRGGDDENVGDTAEVISGAGLSVPKMLSFGGKSPGKTFAVPSVVPDLDSSLVSPPDTGFSSLNVATRPAWFSKPHLASQARAPRARPSPIFA